VKVLIAGNGIAGITAARTMSAGGPGAQIEIYTDEPHPFYLRPKLIQFLAGRLNLQNLYVYPPEWYAKLGIAVHLASRVARLDVSGHRILLEDGTEASYDRLLLAVGSSPFQPPLPGMGQDGVFTLRTIEDALGIKSYAEQCLAAGSTEAVVIGGGLLGLECASALTSLGLQVTLLEHGQWLLHKQIDQEGSVVLQEQIERLGFRVMTNAVPESILASGSVSEVLLKGGLRVPARLVLCAAGVRPNTALAEDAGLDVNRGVVVNGQLRTSAQHVYAVGDVAEYEGQLPCIIPAAVRQGRVAGANMLEPGSVTYHGTVPSTTLKVVGLDLTSVGLIDPREAGYQELRKVDGAKGVYRKLVLRDGRIVGAILLGDKQRVPAVTKLITQRTDVSRYRDSLLDDDVDLQAMTNQQGGAWKK
jgi:nitrite reductase (NADH) large subunit